MKPGSTLEVGDELEVQIEKAVYRGQGLARHEGQVVFVPRGLPGDRIQVRVDALGRGYVRAHALEVIAPAPARRPSPCPYVPRCGGCTYQEADYAGQLQMKEAILRETLERSKVVRAGPIPFVPSPELGWRTRCSFHLDAGPQGVRLGLREEGSHEVIDLEACLQLSSGMNHALRALARDLHERRDLAARIRNVDLAESSDGGGLVVCLETDLHAGAATRLKPLAEHPWLSGLGCVAPGGRFIMLAGSPYVESSVLGTRLRSHVRAFFQANRFLTEPLVRHVADLLPSGGTLLDLYAGVGLFAVPLASRAERVLAAELNPLAVEDARENATRAAAGHVRVDQGDVLTVLQRWPASADERVILDPPRSGAGSEVVVALCARRPAAIVYVSCDPPTLARDLAIFAVQGYRIDSIAGFDLFPVTFHLETVVRLVPA